jgi:hypothetical protein
MMKQKRWIMSLVVTLPAWICVATAQDSHVKSSELKSSSSKSSVASQSAATKPLTPKSAMPAPHKSSAVVPKASKNNANTSAALTRLEQQNSKALGAKSGTPPAPKGTSGQKSAASNSDINFQYQKPKTNTTVNVTNTTKKN